MKYFFVFLLLLTANAISANTNSFYLGVNSGYLQATFDHTIQQRNPPGPKQSIVDTAAKFVAGIDVGYRWFFNRYTLASDVYYFKDNLAHTRYGTTTATEKKLIDDYGLEVMPGYLVLPTLTFQGIVGATLGQLEFNATGTRDNLTNNYSQPGYLLGVGLDYQIHEHFHLTANFAYTYLTAKQDVTGSHTSFYKRDGDTSFKRTTLGLNYVF